MTRAQRSRRPHGPQRPRRRLGLWLVWGGAALIAASIPQLFFGVPLSEGFAPAGLSLGPIAVIGGIVLLTSRRPVRGERYVDDGSALRNLDHLQ